MARATEGGEEMLGTKYDLAAIIRLDSAKLCYEHTGIALVITDGKYVQIEDEKEEK